LGKPVSDGFQRMNRTVFRNDEDNVVFLSGVGSAFDTTNEAHDFNSLFYNYFEDNNWVYYDEINQGDIYAKNKIYACITYPSRRDDGLIAGMVLFSSNAAVFFE
jgi:cobyric acid synthase